MTPEAMRAAEVLERAHANYREARLDYLESKLRLVQAARDLNRELHCTREKPQKEQTNVST